MPRRGRSFAAVVRAAERVLRRNGIDHVFVGAISVIVFGEPRTTRDVDVLARFTEADAVHLAAEFRREGFFASEDDLRAALREGGHSSLEDRRSPLRIDLAPVATPAAEHSLRHAVRVRWKGIEFPVAPPEHTVVMKLKFGSSQDVEDAFGILTEQVGRLDMEGMMDFARRERVLTELRELLRRVEGG